MFVVCWQFIRGICTVYNTFILHQRVDYFGSNVKAVKMCMIVMSDSNKLSKLVMLSDKYNLIKSNKSKLWWLHKYIPTHQFSLVWFTSTKPYNLQVYIEYDAYQFSLNLKEREGEERFCFIAEWYDPHAAFIRRYQFMYYVKDGTVEMVSINIQYQL